MGAEKNLRRSWNKLSDDGFKEMQDLQGVVATNDDTIKLLGESVAIHTKGAEVMATDPETEKLVEQFISIAAGHTKSKDHLMKFQVDAKLFIARLKLEKDEHTLKMIEMILKIVSFK